MYLWLFCVSFFSWALWLLNMKHQSFTQTSAFKPGAFWPLGASWPLGPLSCCLVIHPCVKRLENYQFIICYYCSAACRNRLTCCLMFIYMSCFFSFWFFAATQKQCTHKHDTFFSAGCLLPVMLDVSDTQKHSESLLCQHIVSAWQLPSEQYIFLPFTRAE